MCEYIGLKLARAVCFVTCVCSNLYRSFLLSPLTLFSLQNISKRANLSHTARYVTRNAVRSRVLVVHRNMTHSQTFFHNDGSGTRVRQEIRNTFGDEDFLHTTRGEGGGTNGRVVDLA